MNKEEIEEMQTLKKFKEDIKKEVSIVTKDNYDEDAYIFTLLKLTSKKNKDSLIDYVNSLEESVFDKTFYEMNEYYKRKISREYVKIEDIPSLENVFGIIKDRIKSNNRSIESSKKEYIKHKKELEKEKSYNKIREIESSIYWDNNYIENCQYEIGKYNDLLNQLRHDIRCSKKEKKGEIKNENE